MREWGPISSIAIPPLPERPSARHRPGFQTLLRHGSRSRRRRNLNTGSAVLLPEVFLQALTVCRNLGHGATCFITVNLDFSRQLPAIVNIVDGPAKAVSRGFHITSHHELLAPLLAALAKQDIHRSFVTKSCLNSVVALFT